jgi:hypothetical protein
LNIDRAIINAANKRTGTIQKKLNATFRVSAGQCVVKDNLTRPAQRSPRSVPRIEAHRIRVHASAEGA